MFAAVAANELKGVVPPTAPVNVVVPDPPAIVSACAPFKVLLNVIFPAVPLFEIVPITTSWQVNGASFLNAH